MTLRLSSYLLIVLLLGRCGSEPEPETAVAAASVLAQPMEWPTFDEALLRAESTGKFILIDIYAPWCGWCRRMQQEVYTNAALVSYVQDHFAYGRLNLDDAQTRHIFKGQIFTSQELGYALGAEGTPTTVFLTGDGEYITRCPGYWDLESFTKAVEFVATGAYERHSFSEFSRL